MQKHWMLHSMPHCTGLYRKHKSLTCASVLTEMHRPDKFAEADCFPLLFVAGTVVGTVAVCDQSMAPCLGLATAAGSAGSPTAACNIRSGSKS